jgi:peptidoglycan/LPS O-acetylase OafA/YrhL
MEPSDMENSTNKKVAFANILRGVACLMVVFSHYFGVFWTRPDAAASLVNAPQLSISGGVPLLTWLSREHGYFDSGRFGVALFFLISGFVIPVSLRNQSRIGFAVSRFMRLWPTYAIGLTCTILFILWSSFIFGRSFPVGPEVIALNYSLGLRDLAGVPSLDGIVWTLEIEVRFYLLCILIAPWLRAGSPNAVIAASVVIAAMDAAVDFFRLSIVSNINPWVGLSWVASLDGQMILFMLIGTLFHLHMRRRLSNANLCLLVSSFFLVHVALWRFGVTPGYLAGVGGYAAALALFAFCYCFREKIGERKSLGWLAENSYSLYVVHAVPGYVIMRIAVAHGIVPWICTVLAFLWAFCAAPVLHHLIEVPTHKLGRQWGQYLSCAHTRRQVTAAEAARD